jgi:four helix bundle protein
VRYKKHFFSKPLDAEAEIAETQVWLDSFILHNYIKQNGFKLLYNQLENILSQIVTIIYSPEKWRLLK